MDQFIQFIQSEQGTWSDAKIIHHEVLHQIIHVTHVTFGPTHLILLDPYEKINLTTLPLPCCIAMPTAGDDPDTEVTDYIASQRGPKREVDKPYLIYRLDPEYILLT